MFGTAELELGTVRSATSKNYSSICDDRAASCICQQCVSLNAVCSTWEGASSKFRQQCQQTYQNLVLSFICFITSKRTENRFCMHCNSAILGIEQPAKSVGYCHTNTSFLLYIISLHQLECQRRTYSTRRRWLENESAVSKQPLQTTQINEY